MFMHFSCIRTILLLLIDIVFGNLLLVSLSLSLGHLLMAPKKNKSTPSRNSLHSGTSSSNPTPSSVWFRDDKARQDFLENFSRRGNHSKRQVVLSDFSDTDLLIVIYSRGWESLCDIPISFPSVIIQEFYSNMHGFDYCVPHFSTRIRGKRIVVTPDLISTVLHFPRVAHPDYPGCHCLKTVSKDKLMSLFCEMPSSWGEHQNTPYSAFAKGPRFLNMVMTFAFHTLSHYNSIIEPYARFLLSLFERLTIDFPSHFILSFIDVYKDIVTRDKLIFPSAITWILRHASVSYPESPHFSVMCAINAATVRWREVPLRPKWPQTEIATPPASSTPSTSTPSSSVDGVTLKAIMAQFRRMDACLDTLITEIY